MEKALIPDTGTQRLTWKILVIDDDEEDYLIVKAMLNQARGRKFELTRAASYEEGRTQLLTNQYDAVLVDYDLGAHSGIELIAEATRREYPAPLILYTGRGNYEVDMEAMQAGATLYLTKGEANPLLLERSIRYAIERKQVEQALRASEQEQRTLAEALGVERAKLAAAIDNLPVGVGIGDPAGNTLSLNTAGLELHGFQSEAEMFARLDQYIHDFELRYLDGRLMPVEDWPASRAMRGEFVRDYDLRLRNNLTGDERILSYSVAPIRNSTGETVLIAYVMQEITERKQAERTLRASEARFRQLADAMPQLVWTAQPDGVVDYYNQRYRLFDGIAPVNGDRWEWSPVLHPDDLQATLDAWQMALATGTTYQIEHRVRMIDGSYRWHLSRGIPAFDEQGALVRWYGTATDIEDLRHAQAGLADYTTRLKRSNDELENFAFVASHDLQEPLRKIIQFGQRLQSGGSAANPAETALYLDRIQNAAERMQTMINGLLDLSRISTRRDDFAPVDLKQVAGEVVSDLEGRIQTNGGQVELGELPMIEADALQMRQLFQNLISNAVKFHRPGVSPRVRVWGTVSPNRRLGMVAIHFEDNGIGIEQEFNERIFMPFKRLHGRSEYDGTGLGLTICHRIVERHRGRIEVNSQPGEGTTFTVHLPQFAMKEV